MGSRKKAQDGSWLKDFEAFTAERNVLPAGPPESVTIMRSGIFSLSPDLVTAMVPEGMEEPHVRLHFRKSDRNVAIVLADPDDTGAYKLTHAAKGQRVYVNGKAFRAKLEREGVTFPDDRVTVHADAQESPAGILFALP